MIERRRSGIHGWGVFATRTIPKNKRIIDYAGEKIPTELSEEREAQYLAKRHIWCFRLNSRWVRDAAVGGNVARYINHSCKPNCWVEIVGDIIWIRASRTIARGEELTYNYATDGAKIIPCRCRPGCRTRI